MAMLGGLAQAGGSIAGGIMQQDSAHDAQKMQWDMYNKMRGDLQPFMQGGMNVFQGLTGLAPGMTQNLGAANNQLANLLGLNPGGMATAMSSLQQTPGYQFALQQGQQGVDRGMAARGLGVSGGEMKAIDQYSQGLASQNYNNVVNQLMGFQGQGFGQLAGLAGMGQNAASGLGTAGMGAATNAGEAGMWGSQQMAAGINSGIGSMFGQHGGFTGMNWGDVSKMFSDRRLKEDIRPEGNLLSGVPVYTYRYRGSDIPQIGVMADEVERVAPRAVSVHPSGFKQVDYGRVARVPARRPVSQLPAFKVAA